MDCLGLLAKYWQPGAVKTRLGAQIGMQSAADVYLAMLKTTLRRFSDVADQRTAVFSPPDRGGDFASLTEAQWQIEAQVEGDLGARMKAFFSTRRSHGANAVVMIGADCPHLPKNCLFDAFKLLNEYDAVIGPSTDGGYYLIGLRNELPPVFDDIPWSTSHVLSETIRRLAAGDRSFVLLDETFDVDDVTSLRRLADVLSDNAMGREYDALRSAIANLSLAGDQGTASIDANDGSTQSPTALQ